MKKKTLVGILLLAAAVAIGFGVYHLVSSLGALVAAAIEKHGSEVTETSVTVSGVDISLREGKGSIRGLRVASPDGFAARDAFSLGDITLDLDVASIRGNPIVLEEVRIRAPEIHAEIRKDGSSNIQALRERAQEYQGSRTGSDSAPGKNIRIKTFVLEKARVEVDASALGLEKSTLELPEIRLSNVGGDRGAPPDQVAKVILTAIAKRTASEVAESGIQRQIEKELGGSLPDKAKELLDRIGN